jgi:hypothetical protein
MSIVGSIGKGFRKFIGSRKGSKTAGHDSVPVPMDFNPLEHHEHVPAVRVPAVVTKTIVSSRPASARIRTAAIDVMQDLIPMDPIAGTPRAPIADTLTAPLPTDTTLTALVSSRSLSKALPPKLSSGRNTPRDSTERADADGLISKRPFLPPLIFKPAATPSSSETLISARDALISSTKGPKLDICNWTNQKLTTSRLAKYQDAALAYFKTKNVGSIVESKRMASRWRVCKEDCLAALKELAVFHLERGEKVVDGPIDWMDPMHIPIPLLGPVVLLRGTNPRLDTLRDVIRRFREIQEMVKREMYEPTLSEEANKSSANSIFEKPMADLANFAGNKYNLLLFTSTQGSPLASGICLARHDQLMIWLDYIQACVMKNVEESDIENTRMELLRLPHLKLHQVSNSARVEHDGHADMYMGDESSEEEDE